MTLLADLAARIPAIAFAGLGGLLMVLVVSKVFSYGPARGDGIGLGLGASLFFVGLLALFAH